MGVRELFAPGCSLSVRLLEAFGNAPAPSSIFPVDAVPRARCRIMAAVNQNMFDASIAADRPGGASLMLLPLNLIAQIVSNVSAPVSKSSDQIVSLTHPLF